MGRSRNRCTHYRKSYNQVLQKSYPGTVRSTPHLDLRQRHQFTSKEFKHSCDELHIERRCTIVSHLATNCQTENVNRTLLHRLRMRFAALGGSWVDELHSVLWSFRTTPSEATGETPFNLVYKSEAILPAKIGIQCYRVEFF